VIEALRQVIRHPRVSDRELTEIIGPPDYLTGCAVTGDLAAMAAGQATDLVLHASITAAPAGGRQGRVESGQLPFRLCPEPGSGLDEVIGRLSRVYGVQARVRVHFAQATAEDDQELGQGLPR
jgi:hypothetical protein